MTEHPRDPRAPVQLDPNSPPERPLVVDSDLQTDRIDYKRRAGAPAQPATPPAGPPAQPATDPAPLPPHAPPPPTPAPPHTGTTLVVEEGVFKSRLRRPRDLVGALLAILGALFVVAIALTAQATTIAIDDDLTSAQRSLPDFLWGALSVVAGLGLVMLPLVTAVSMLVRRRGRQLLESFAALTLATIALTLLSTVIREYGTEALYRALTGTVPGATTLAYPTNPLLGGMVAFVTTARLMSRSRWNVITSVIIASATLVSTVSGGSTIAAQGLSILVGVAIGLLVRYALGTPTTRPSGTDVATTLMLGGIPLVMLRARGGTESGRQYLAVTSSGEHLDVVVLDRDLEGSGLVGTLWRSIRLRESNDATSGLSMRAAVERAALMSYAAQAAGVPSPQLRMAAMVSADSALLAYETREGRVVVPANGHGGQGAGIGHLGSQGSNALGVDSPGHPDTTAVAAASVATASGPPVAPAYLAPSPSSTPSTIPPTDAELDAAWRAVAALQQRFIAHQNLHAENVRYAGAEGTHLTGMESGIVAAGDVVLRLDIAELLVTQSLQAGVPAAVGSARRVLGDEAVLRALPVLQRVALSGPTRSALRARRDLLNELRAALLTVNPTVDVEPIDLERLKPRTVVTLLLGTVAGYLLLSQLAQVNLADVIATADWRWAGVALGLSFLTYVGAALSLSGFVPDRLRFFRTLQAQFAASFATLVSPPTLGAVAVNARYLNRAGLPPAAAAATVGVSQVAAFVVHVSLMLLIGVAAGTQADLSFNPPRSVIIGIGIFTMIVGGLASISHVRRWLTNRIRPMVEQVIPRLATVAQQPGKLVEGFGGILLLNVAYCLALVASVRAFSDEATIAAICFVYLAGSTLGQAAPTPGGLGVVEAAIAAGLTAAGVDSALAVSATLLFRTVTFWLPTVPGWFSFRNLTAKGLL